MPEEKNTLSSLFAIAWYLLHPANAETINYIISRSDTLSTFFVVLGFTLYTCSAVSRKYFIYLVPVAIGSLAKPTAVMFAPILFVYILFFEEHSGFDTLLSKSWKVGKKTVPAFLLCAAMYLFVRKMEPATWSAGGTSAFGYFITQPYVILRYFTTFFFPIDLSADTDWVTFTSIWNIRCLVGFAFLATFLVAIYGLSMQRPSRPIAFGLCWFLLALLPSSTVPLAEVMNDHRLFFPYIGLVISITWALTLLVRRLSSTTAGVRPAAYVAAIFLLGACAWGTWQRNKIWATEESLWKDVTIKSPGNGRGQMNYGLILMGRGDYPGAESYFEKGLQRWPYYSYLHINMGILKEAEGKPQEAESFLKNGILNSQGTNPEGFFYYARFLKNQKRYPEALQYLKKLFQLTDAHINGHYLQMEILQETEDYPALKEAALQTLSVSANDVTAQYYLNIAETGHSKLDELVSETKARPTAEGWLNLSLTYFNAQRYMDCIQAAQEVLKLNPAYAEAWNNIGAAYGQLKNWDKEIAACEKALQIKPTMELARNNLAFAKLMQKEKNK